MSEARWGRGHLNRGALGQNQRSTLGQKDVRVEGIGTKGHWGRSMLGQSAFEQRGIGAEARFRRRAL